jgi:hypothetical protein
MNLATALALAALAGSVVLLLQTKRKRLVPIIAVAVSGFEVLMAFGLRVSLGNFPTAAVLGGALCVVGVMLWLKVSGRTPVTAATVVAFVGALQLLAGLRVF